MKKRIAIFVLTTFALTLAASFGVAALAQRAAAQPQNLLFSALSQFAVMAIMFLPTIGMLFTRVVTKEGFKDMYLRPNFRGNIRYYVMAWFLPSLLTVIGAAVYFVLFPQHFDAAMSTMSTALAASGAEESLMGVVAISQVVSALTIGPLLNFLPSLGEEWGWRGYLLPKLLSVLPAGGAILLNGVIWGIWHFPLIYLGHNYGTAYAGYPWFGFAAMTVFCMGVGCLLSYITIRTKSALPAAIGHGALNAIAALGLIFSKGDYNPILGPSSAGLIGGVGFTLFGLVCLIWSVRHCKKEIQ